MPSRSLVIGLLADTHLPYRVPHLHPIILEHFRGVDLILHAGDVDEPAMLAPLQKIAPLYAVRGNYHIRERSYAGRSLPWSVELTVCGFRIVVEHGHRIGPTLWLWKAISVIRYLFLHHWSFPTLERKMIRVLLQRYPQADIIIFGHTHRYFSARYGNTLLINPGAAMPTAYLHANEPPSIARLYLRPQTAPRVEQILIPIGEDNLHPLRGNQKQNENP